MVAQENIKLKHVNIYVRLKIMNNPQTDTVIQAMTPTQRMSCR